MGAVRSYHGIISLGQSADKGIRICDPGRFLDFLLGGIQLSKTNVVRNSPRKQMGILQHDSKRLAKRFFTDVPYINSIINYSATQHISSTLVREISMLGGAVAQFVSPPVLAHLERQRRERARG